MAQAFYPQRMGEKTVEIARQFIGPFGLLYLFAANISSLRIAPSRMVLYKQIYFSGIESLNRVALLGTLIGIVIITQATNIAGANAVLTGKILIWSVSRELGPLFAAIVIIARSCTAVTAELGLMKVNGEVTVLRNLGIDPVQYLIVPRIAGITLSVFILTFYFQAAAVAGGLVVTNFFKDIPIFQHVDAIFSALNFIDMEVSLLKSFSFGLLIATVSCYHGFNVEASVTRIPVSISTAVMQSLFWVFILDGVITLVSFL
jgi:phospholipid/cholesterol/gamma-HCH transport system permease protein